MSRRTPRVAIVIAPTHGSIATCAVDSTGEVLRYNITAVKSAYELEKAMHSDIMHVAQTKALDLVTVYIQSNAPSYVDAHALGSTLTPWGITIQLDIDGRIGFYITEKMFKRFTEKGKNVKLPGPQPVDKAWAAMLVGWATECAATLV